MRVEPGSADERLQEYRHADRPPNANTTNAANDPTEITT
jgi:hypothetical protein